MKKHALTAVALTAALAMGSVPAFAATTTAPDPTNPTLFESDGTQSTTVSIQTDKSQLSATVPVKMTLIAPVMGGDIVAPSKEKYAIKNNSLIPIYVTNIKGASVANSGWTLLNNNPGPEPTDTVGDIALTVNGTQVKEAGIDIKDTTFKVEAKTSTDPSALELQVEGKTSAIKNASDTAVEAVKITYTISGTDPTPAAPSN